MFFILNLLEQSKHQLWGQKLGDIIEDFKMIEQLFDVKDLIPCPLLALLFQKMLKNL